ncbi:metallophosphoesterase [Desulfopila aestuarii]|uniref:Calcineurin-like phosphoesterase domain-containing protein n=1 Tax=Desulfopila aestuarii DSM 18488 TaxID=1121416 RepID=A0A1M7Y361_9BACT|nr:metallophosphoesterase [Desulfopila aestuarii]SHO46311.1 hypothetical protein SAMN02745220_01421 [Desulfopila aestuarii DSM 18488]
MRIVAFGDIHMSGRQCRCIPGADSAELLIATGDLTNYGKNKDAKEVLDELLAVNPNVLAVIGNLDHFEINDYLDQLDMNLHGQARLIQGKLWLIGAGGSNITPFRTPTEYSESEINEILMRGYNMAAEYRSLMHYGKERLPTILVSHTPPRDTLVDRLRDGRHVGSSAVRAFIETYQPELCLTGHIHEAQGEDWIGKTHIINPGMFRNGGWVEILLNQTTLTATLK